LNRFLKSLRTRLESRQQRIAPAPPPDAADTPAPVLTGTGRDYSVMSTNDRALKIHLPEAALVALNELVTKHHSSLATLIRHVLFLYLYGRYDLIALLEREHYQFDLINHTSGRFMRVVDAENRTADLGKNNQDVKTWIPEQMYTDLEQSAEARDIPLSVFVREIIVSYLFGHVALPERPLLGSMQVPDGDVVA
jgi:hypothetical protein